MTDKTQPEALRLADELAQRWGENMACPELEAAAELRLLHAENARLSGLCDKWNSECDEFREDNKRLAALVEAQQHTRIAELEAELEAVGAGGGQALSAAPAGWRVVPENATDAMVFAGCTVDNATHMKVENSALKAAVWSAMLAAAPKAAPGELHDHQILAITTAYEQGVGKGRQAHESGKEIANPYGTGYRCDLAWQYGYKEGKEQAERIAEAAPQQEAQEPVAWQGVHDQTDLYYTKPAQADVRPLYTAPQPAPAPLSERDAFEAAWEKLHGKRPVLWSRMFAEHKMETPSHSEGKYFARDEQAAWKLWQARAALAAQGGK